MGYFRALLAGRNWRHLYTPGTLYLSRIVIWKKLPSLLQARGILHPAHCNREESAIICTCMEHFTFRAFTLEETAGTRTHMGHFTLHLVFWQKLLSPIHTWDTFLPRIVIGIILPSLVHVWDTLPPAHCNLVQAM